jgi:site-specific DNA-methyltransferase (adenine-specific)
VKSGASKGTDVRELIAVVAREKAAVGVLICLEDTTKDMRTEAASAGSYVSPWGGARYPKIQLLTIEDLFGGRKIILPPDAGTSAFKKAPRARGQRPTQPGLFG